MYNVIILNDVEVKEMDTSVSGLHLQCLLIE
jgi:hypothetical protein